MKKFILSCCLSLFAGSGAFAQTGTVTTVAGCNMCILTPADGAVATMAEFYESAGIALDASRNVYIVDRGVHKLRRILSSTNLVYTVAGDGVAGFAGDGMTASATGVRLNNPNGLCIDAGNNIYIADEGNGRVRKIDATTGIINTIAGGGASIADGVPATSASLTPRCVYVDAAGNIYTSGNNQLRKINGTTGIITTVAGNGTVADAGDGGPATAAGIQGPVEHITMDAVGNIYFVSAARNSVRKINVSTGIITTVIGGSTCPAGSVFSCGVDVAGNVIVMDRANYVIRQWDAATNVTYTIAGGGSSVAEYTPALSAYVHGYRMYMDYAAGNIYFTDSSHWIRKMSYSPSSYATFGRDSFVTSINKLCSGPVLSVNTANYTTAMNLKTWFGDGTTDVTSVSPNCSGMGGIAVISHVYANSGTYTIKQVLYNGTIPLDSMHRTYQHSLCNELYVKNYYEANTNCIKESTDNLISKPAIFQVDSNGIAVDTISATSGFYYKAYGNTGDVYSFKPIIIGSGLNVICPVSGILYDTLKPRVYNLDTNYLGFSCSSGTLFDLSIDPVIPVTGINDQWGHIYVSNVFCDGAITNSVTLTFSPKYKFTGNARPPASSYTSNSITWNSFTASAVAAKPVDLYYVVWRNTIGGPMAGDTVQTHVTVTPISGDSNPGDNTAIVIDTVKASCDPNAISVVPGNGCIYSGNKLTYTVKFENTGNDTAFNIYVLDTISDNLNLETMRIIMASHPMDVALIHSGGYNILKFDFPDINLLDSSHHGLCDGAFMYNINLKNGLADGTQIPNRVGIYFDYNPVVLTNTVVNTIGCPTGIEEVAATKTAEIYPNPAAGLLTIQTGSSNYQSYTITNTLGQTVSKGVLGNSLTNVSVAALSSGMYYITLSGNDGNTVLKFVKN